MVTKYILLIFIKSILLNKVLEDSLYDTLDLYDYKYALEMQIPPILNDKIFLLRLGT